MRTPPTRLVAPLPPAGWVPLRDLPPCNAEPDRAAVRVADLLSKVPVPDGEPVNQICRTCRKAYQAQPYRLPTGRVMISTTCMDCAEVPSVSVLAIVETYGLDVPPEYARTNINDPRLHTALVASAQQWRSRGDGCGLGFSGPPGLGKTRCLAWRLLELAREGKSVAFCSALRLAKLAADQFADGDRERDTARKRLRYIRSCDGLLLDDLGKERLTERAAAVFTEVVEHRTIYGLPIFWTAQYNSAQLIAHLGEDRGRAIVRRLREFTEPTRLE